MMVDDVAVNDCKNAMVNICGFSMNVDGLTICFLIVSVLFFLFLFFFCFNQRRLI